MKRLPVRERLCRFIAVLHASELARVQDIDGKYTPFFDRLRVRVSKQLTPKDLGDIRMYVNEYIREGEKARDEAYREEQRQKELEETDVPI